MISHSSSIPQHARYIPLLHNQKGSLGILPSRQNASLPQALGGVQTVNPASLEAGQIRREQCA